MTISFDDLRFHLTFKSKLYTDEIAMIVISQTEMNISSWRFHTTFKNKLYTYESMVWLSRLFAYFVKKS